MTLSQDRLRDIYNETGGDLSQAAARLGIESPELPTTTIAYAPRRREPPAGTGHRPDRNWPDPRYIVAIRHCDGYWAAADQSSIDKARIDYEAGTHEMCTGRDGDWFVLFSIPRRKRCGARRFFNVEGV